MKPKRELPIGIFDSGLGGLTVARQIHYLMPHEELIYLGDTARVPYGTKSAATVVRFAYEDTQFLIEQGVKAVVVACNTASALALPKLELDFEVPIYGVIQPGVTAALAQSKSMRLGVIGTTATIRSGAYARAIQARSDVAEVVALATPLLVSLVEEGWTHHPVTKLVLREYLEPALRRGIDTLVLGCTHYPLLEAALREVVGPKVALVDSAATCARYVQAELARLKLLTPRHRQLGKVHPFVTDEADRFREAAERFLGFPTELPLKVELPVFGTFRTRTLPARLNFRYSL